MHYHAPLYADTSMYMRTHINTHVYMYTYRRSNPWIGVYILLDLDRIWFAVSSAELRHSPFATNSDQIALRTDPSTCGKTK